MGANVPSPSVSPQCRPKRRVACELDRLLDQSIDLRARKTRVGAIQRVGPQLAAHNSCAGDTPRAPRTRTARARPRRRSWSRESGSRTLHQPPSGRRRAPVRATRGSLARHAAATVKRSSPSRSGAGPPPRAARPVRFMSDPLKPRGSSRGADRPERRASLDRRATPIGACTSDGGHVGEMI